MNFTTNWRTSKQSLGHLGEKLLEMDCNYLGSVPSPCQGKLFQAFSKVVGHVLMMYNEKFHPSPPPTHSMSFIFNLRIILR